MRPPSATNGPKVGAGVDGGAVVTWQEPDQSGAARIWVRRIFGTTPGPILEASPTSWEGSSVSGDVDAFSLAVTPLDQARIAMRLAPNSLARSLATAAQHAAAGLRRALQRAGRASSPFSPRRALLCPASASPASRPMKKAAPKDCCGWPSSPATSFAGGGRIRVGRWSPFPCRPDRTAVPGAEAQAALDPEGGGVVAYPALDPAGHQALAVRQEFPGGAAQVGAADAVPRAARSPQPTIGASGSGDALIAFRQGEPGRFQIVADAGQRAAGGIQGQRPQGVEQADAGAAAWDRGEERGRRPHLLGAARRPDRQAAAFAVAASTRAPRCSATGTRRHGCWRPTGSASSC